MGFSYNISIEPRRYSLEYDPVRIWDRITNRRSFIDEPNAVT